MIPAPFIKNCHSNTHNRPESFHLRDENCDETT